ncbi:MAG: flagellar biosynthetic protein FliR [Myxococcota bacterium]
MTFELALMPILHALLGSIRIFVMMLAGPLFSHPSLSMRIRVVTSVLIAWAAAPVGVDAMARGDWDVLSISGAVLTEVMIGASVGIGAGLIFAGILQLGEFAAVQGGLGAARSIDPTSGASSVAIGSAFNTFAMLIFLVIGGHHELIMGIVQSFEIMPIGGGMPESILLFEVAKLGSVIWEVAFRLAAPITVAIFVENVATGVLGRAMPQLNLLIVNLPLHVGMLLLVLGLGASDYVHAFKDVIEVWPTRVFQTLLGGSYGG